MDHFHRRPRLLSNAVNRSIQSHRWFGPFVQQQLPETLKLLAGADNVLAISVSVGGEAETKYSAGESARIDYSLANGEHLLDETLQYVSSFPVRSDPPMIHGMFAESGEPVESKATDMLTSIVVLDRTGTIEQMRRESVNRILMLRWEPYC